MSELFLDVLDGSVDHKTANAACNVANTMLKGIQIQQKMVGLDQYAEQRMVVIRYLQAQNQAVKPILIARETGLDHEVLIEVLQHEAFVKDIDGIALK